MHYTKEETERNIRYVKIGQASRVVRCGKILKKFYCVYAIDLKSQRELVRTARWKTVR